MEEFPESLRKYLDRHVSRRSDSFDEEFLERERSTWLTPWRWNRGSLIAIGLLSPVAYVVSYPLVLATLQLLGYPEPAWTTMRYAYLPLGIVMELIGIGPA